MIKLNEILAQPEGRKVEFKEKIPSKSDLLKTVVAFANDAGGEIYIGIKDRPREITGLKEEDLINFEEQIASSIYDNCYPIILPEIMFLNYQGKYLMVVKILRGNNPPYYLKSKGKQKGTFIRVGSSSRLANEDIMAELERRKRNLSFDALPEYSVEFKESEYKAFDEHFTELTGEKSDKTVLEKLNLLHHEQGKTYPVNAMVLLADDLYRRRFFPYAKIECARFKGDIPGNFIDQKTIDVPLSLQAEQAYQFVLRHISQGSEYEGVYRKDRWEYPAIAIREVIRNAVIHRDYSLKGKDIKIAVFDDKIEITSPGNLLPTVDYNLMEAGQSDIRNRVLAPVFKKLGIIEQWGNGLKMIYNELKDYPEIDFVWSEPGMAFRVSFIKKNHTATTGSRPKTVGYRRILSDTVGKPSENRRIPSDCSEQEKTVLSYLFENKTIKSKQVEKLLNLKESRTRELLKQMVNKKLIIKLGKGKSTHYKVFGKGEFS